MQKKKNKNEEYAAIYARISGQKDNNSIQGQMEECKLLAEEKGLLIYDSYYDKISGKSTPPEERTSYKRFLSDAKAGCFKTLIIYRYDRLVRNYGDWIKTSAILKSLGVKLLLSDKTQPPCSEDGNDNFLTNLMVLFSDFEPDNIKQRISEGQRIIREEGIYNAGRAAPFAYEKRSQNRSIGESIKTFFVGYPVGEEFVVYIYKSFYDEMEQWSEEYKGLIKEIHTKSKSFISKLRLNIKNGTNVDDYGDSNFNNFAKSIKKYEKKEITVGMSNIWEHFFIKKKKQTDEVQTVYSKSVENILKNNIYGGFLLINANKDINPLGGFSKNKDGNIEFDINKFIKTKNIKPLVEKELFITVYSNLMRKDLEVDSKFNPFLFKTAVKCSICKKGLLLNDVDNTLTCIDKCISFFYDDFKEYILGLIVDSIFSDSTKIFNSFKQQVENKIITLNNSLEIVNKQKDKVLKDFLLNEDTDKTRMNNFILNTNKDIAFKKRIISNSRQKLADIVALENLINSSLAVGLDIESSKYLEIRKFLVKYIIDNENYFTELLEKLVSKIKVGVNYKSESIKTKITYEFRADENSNIYKGIYERAKG